MSDRNDIRIDVVGDADDFGRSTVEAERQLDALKAAAGAMATVAASAAGGMAAWATAQVAATFAIKDTADEVGKLAQRMGESVESVSELRHAFGLAGADAEQMAGLMKSLETKAQDAAKGTGQAAAAYKAMGVSVTDGNGALKEGRLLLEEVSDKIAGYRDGAAKAALVQDALGGSWVKMIPLLNGGADGFRDAAKEAHELGVVFDEKLTKQSAELNDNLTRIKTAAEGAKIALGSELLPVVRNLSEEFVAGIKAAGGFWAALSMGATLNPFKSNLDNLATVRSEIAKMEADQKEYGYLDEQRWNRKQAQLKYLTAMQGDLDKRGLSALSDGLPADEKPNAPMPAVKEPKARKVKPDDTAHKEYLASLKDQAKAELDLINVRQKAGDLLAVYGREDQMVVQRIGRSAELALMTERERGAVEAVYAAQDKSAKRQEQIIKQITDEATRTATLAAEKEQLVAQIDAVREASLASYDAQQTFEHGWQKALQSYSDNATNAALTAQGAFQTMTGVIEDSLVGFALNTKLTFKDMAQSILKYLAQVAAKQAAMGLMKMATSFAGAYFSSGPTMAGAGSSTENWIDSGGLAGARAGGGPVAAGKTYLVGEQGPELLRMGSSGGSVVPNSAIGGSSFTLQQVFNISGDGGGDQSSSGDGAGGFKQFADMMAAVTKQVIVQEMRSGGMLEKARTA